jgi:hypothetical protein
MKNRAWKHYVGMCGVVPSCVLVARKGSMFYLVFYDLLYRAA